MNLKIITALIAFFKNNKSASMISGLCLIIVIVGILWQVSESKLEKTEIALAQAVSDTVYVKGDIVEKPVYVYDERIDTLIKTNVVYKNNDVYHYDTIVVTKTVTEVVEKDGLFRFSDDSNEFVSIKGWFKYPVTTGVTIEYKNKRLKKYRDITLLAGLGWRLHENRPFIKSDLLYKKVGIGFYAGKDFYGATFNYRLL